MPTGNEISGTGQCTPKAEFAAVTANARYLKTTNPPRLSEMPAVNQKPRHRCGVEAIRRGAAHAATAGLPLQLLRDVTAFREISSRVETARPGGVPVPALEREQRRLSSGAMLDAAAAVPLVPGARAR